MRNGWTYYQFQILRVLLGGFLIVHFAQLFPFAKEVFSNQGALANAFDSPLIYLFPNILALIDSPLALQCFLGLGIISGFAILFNKYDKLAAFYCFYLLACLLSRNPLITNPSLPYLGWILVFYLFVPKKDNNQPWQLPSTLYFAAWAILALTYSYSGYTKLLSPSWVSGDTIHFVLQNPLARDTFFREWLLAMPAIYLKCLTLFILGVELLFVPLAFIKKLRPLVWLGMLCVQFGFLICLNFADLTFPMLIMHLLTFDPAWIKPKYENQRLWLFYDGECGLCHRYVKFVLSEDQKQNIHFAPLQGELFKQKVPGYPTTLDTMLLLTPNGVKAKSDAMIGIFEQLGGLYRLFALLLLAMPKSLRDFVYDVNAKYRLSYFKKPEELCPIVAKGDKDRFSW